MRKLNYLNTFNYYADLKSHEDNLTRAFLVVLKNSPFIFKRFIDFIVDQADLERDRKVTLLEDLQEIKIYSQCAGNLEKDACLINIPVLITEKKVKEIPAPEKSKIKENTRADGVVCLKPNIAFTIEVKKYNNVNWDQVYGHLNLFGDDIIEKRAVNITWDEVVKIMLNSLFFYDKLFEREACVSGIEKNMINDFIDYLTIYFPHLMPYKSLELCRDNKFAYRKYLIELMENLEIGEIVSEEPAYMKISDTTLSRSVERFYINIDEELDNIILRCYPSDTTNQGKNFYNSVNIEDILSLKKKGWEIISKLHFSYIGSHLVYSSAKLSLEKYIQHWKDNHDKIKQYKEEEFKELYDYLLKNELITETNIKKLEEEFNQTARDHINIAPGIKMTYKLPIEKAEKLEKEEELIAEINKIIGEAYSVCS